MDPRFGDGVAVAAKMGGVLAGGALVGAILVTSPKLAALLVALVAFAAVAMTWGLSGILLVLTASLPWLIVLSELLPRAVATLTAAATAFIAMLVLRPRSDGSRASSTLRFGLFLFFASVLISLVRPDSAGPLQSAHLIQAAKYVIFPLMVLVVTEATNRQALVPLRRVALWSGVAAVGVNLILGAAGIAKATYYGSGEILGFGSEHSLALLAGFVTAAGLAGRLTLTSTLAVAIGAIATVATGVRSTLPGLAIAAVARMVSAGTRLRTIAVVGVAVTAVFASGAQHVVEARFHQAKTRGEFKSFNTFGSGRGAIYSAALHTWWVSPPSDWLIGTGLGTIPRILQERLGDALGGHDDALQVGVELGIVGLAGFLLIWWALIVRAESRLPLLVLASFALLNGTLEYGPPLVIGLILTMGIRGSPRRSEQGAGGEATSLEASRPIAASAHAS